MPPISRRMRRHLAMCLTIVALAAVYMYQRADIGWIPFDDGYLGHSAERVLQGELPHRDFDDIYTGGLAFMHGAAFRLFGVKLIVLRWVLFAFSLLFVAALYAIAAQFAGPLASGTATLLAAAWGPPIYFVSMSSWHNLFWATFGTLALLLYLKSERRHWLFVAGVCAGASFLIKSVGLFFLAAILLFFVYREQLLSTRDGEAKQKSEHVGFRIFQAVGLGLFCALLLLLVSTEAMAENGAGYLLLFVLPGAVLSAFLGWNEAMSGRGAFALRLRRLLGLALPFAAGLAAPLVLFLIPYAASGGLGKLWHGVFVSPFMRLTYSADPPPTIEHVWGALPLALLLAVPLLAGTRMARMRFAQWLSRHRRKMEIALLVIVAAALFTLVRRSDELLNSMTLWDSLPSQVPMVTFMGCLTLAAARRRTQTPPARRQQIFLLLAVCAMVSMIQFPFSNPMYFCYAAPLLPAVFLAVLSAQKGPPRLVYGGVALLALVFIVMFVNSYWGRVDALDLPRAGLRVRPRHAKVYEHTMRVISRESREGSFIWATPDSPEIYFLANRRNPTRTLFDYMDPDYEEPKRRQDRLLSTLEEHEVDVVVVKHKATHSRSLEAKFLAEIAVRYPRSARNGRFYIFWRDRKEAGQQADKQERPAEAPEAGPT